MKSIIAAKVYHKTDNREDIIPVAKINLLDRGLDLEEALHYAFQATNNICGSWSRPIEFDFNGETYQNADYLSNVKVLAPKVYNSEGQEMGRRSTMMFDIISIMTETEGGDLEIKSYTVDMTGFSEINLDNI